jgi:hypothetical protein
MHDQGIFPWSIQRFLFSRIQRNTNLTNHCKYVIIG